MTATYTEDVPLSLLEDDGEGMIRVTFDYVPGAGPSERTIADPYGDPGWPAEMEILGGQHVMDDGSLVVTFLTMEECDKIVDYLMENWEPPTGPDPDDERDRRRDEELTDRRGVR